MNVIERFESDTPNLNKHLAKLSLFDKHLPLRRLNQLANRLEENRNYSNDDVEFLNDAEQYLKAYLEAARYFADTLQQNQRTHSV